MSRRTASDWGTPSSSPAAQIAIVVVQMQQRRQGEARTSKNSGDVYLQSQLKTQRLDGPHHAAGGVKAFSIGTV